MDYSNVLGGPTNAQCDQWKQGAVSYINQIHPRLVIATTQDKPATDARGRDITQSEYSSAFVEFLKSISATGRHIAVLGDIPQLAQDGPTCLARHETDVKACSTPTEDAALSAVQETQVVAADAVRALYIYDIPWFCTSSICPAIIGNFDVYEDQYHMTSTYANYLSNVLKTALTLNGDLGSPK
jgi:hypothetical protein